MQVLVWKPGMDWIFSSMRRNRGQTQSGRKRRLPRCRLIPIEHPHIYFPRRIAHTPAPRLLKKLIFETLIWPI